jgi:hypothetical protein
MPLLGKARIAQALARAGLHLGQTTVGRILKEKPVPAPTGQASQTKRHVVTSKYPNHLWMTEPTTVPNSTRVVRTCPSCACGAWRNARRPPSN